MALKKKKERKKTKSGAGEMPQRLKEVAAVAEDPESIPSIHAGCINNCLELQHPICTLPASADTCTHVCIYTHAAKTFIHIFF